MDVLSIVSIIERIGLTLAVGSSTFALIFYFKAFEDGAIDASEKNFMHTVYAVLRIGMSLLVLSLVTTALTVVSWSGSIGPEALIIFNASFFFKCLLIVVILTNAMLMDKHVMPMWLGPALAGASWYSFFFVSLLSFDMPLETMLVCYGLFIVLMTVLLDLIRRLYLKKQGLC